MDEQHATELVSDMYEAFYSPLVRYASRSLGTDLAEDVVQETFMNLYRALRLGREVDNPKAWAFAAVRRAIGKAWRQSTDLPHCEGSPVVELLPAPEANGFSQARFDEVSRLFFALTGREEEVLVLRMSE